jgi:hypothetical protein
VDDFETARQEWIAASEKLMRLQYENPWLEQHFGRYREGITERENPPINYDEITRGIEAAMVVGDMLLDLARIIRDQHEVKTLYQVFYHIWREIHRRLMGASGYYDEEGRFIHDYPPGEVNAFLEQCENERDEFFHAQKRWAALKELPAGDPDAAGPSYPLTEEEIAVRTANTSDIAEKIRKAMAAGLTSKKESNRNGTP